MIEKICPKCGRHYKAHTIHDSIKCYQCQMVIPVEGKPTKMQDVEDKFCQRGYKYSLSVEYEMRKAKKYCSEGSERCSIKARERVRKELSHATGK